MKTFECPKCHHVVKARGTECSHRCTMNRNRITSYVVTENKPVRVIGAAITPKENP